MLPFKSPVFTHSGFRKPEVTFSEGKSFTEGRTETAHYNCSLLAPQGLLRPWSCLSHGTKAGAAGDSALPGKRQLTGDSGCLGHSKTLRKRPEKDRGAMPVVYQPALLSPEAGVSGYVGQTCAVLLSHLWLS